MTERPTMSGAGPSRPAFQGEVPSPEVEAFIRFCHRRRHAGWPELYDEMCAVAARREFNGWGHDQLAAHGLAFSLQAMPRLAGWVRAVLAGGSERRETEDIRAAPARPQPQAAGI
ncbi:MAG: hypothetical protein ACRDGV_04390 [Candidatus Limnocylindria bacterium]